MYFFLVWLLSLSAVTMRFIHGMPLHSPYLYYYFFNVFKCFYLFLKERERQSMSGGGAERGRHRIRSRLQAPAVSTEPDAGLEPTNCEITT